MGQRSRHEKCDIHTLSMTSPDLPVDGRERLYSLPKALKHFLLHDLLSCSYLQHCVWSVITGHNSPQTVVCRGELRTSAQRVTSLSLAGAATPTVECKLLMGRRSRRECDIYTLSMTYNLTCLSMYVRDCIRYQSALKHFIHLRSSSKRLYRSIRDAKASKLQARKPNRNTKQNFVNPSNIAHTRRTVAT